MKNLLSWVAEYLSNVPGQVRKVRWLVLLFFVAGTALCVYGISRLQFDFTIERWLEQDDAAYVAYNQFHDQFGSDDGVVIVYKPRDGDVFSVASLRAVKGIRDELVDYRSSTSPGAPDTGGKLQPGETSALDHIVEVNSLINAPVLSVEDDVLRSRWLVGETVPTDAQALQEIRATAHLERDIPLTYFSRDMKYGAIYIKTDFGAIPVDSGEADVNATVDMSMASPAMTLDEGAHRELPQFKPTDMADYVALNAALNRILDQPQYAGHLEYYKVGNTIDSENQIRMGEEMGTLYLAALLIMAFALLMIFRSFAGVVWPLLLIVLSVIWTLGLAGLLGLSASPFVVLTILLILTVGMADVTHLISGYVLFRHSGLEHEPAMRAIYEKAGLACLLTTVTAMAGMLSLLYTNLVPVKNFSLMSAIGVGVVFFMAIYLLPVLLGFWAPSPPAPLAASPSRRNRIATLIARLTPDFLPVLQRWLDRIVPAVAKRPFAFIVPFMVVFAICVVGAFKVKVDYSIYDQYHEESNFFQSIKLMDERMAGSSRMSLYLDLGAENAFQDPAVLHVIDDMQRKLREEYGRYVVTTSSIVDVVKDAYRKQNEGRPEMYAIPATREALSQTLFTFNVADPEERGRLVSEDYRKANVTVTLRSYGSNEYTEVFERMKTDINGSLALIKERYPAAQVSITGLFAMGMKTADYLVVNELQSFGLSLLIISAILLVIFSSFRAGVLSLIPNVIPSFLPLGILGLTGQPLDFYTMMLAPIAVGIAVDDTIHFVTVYRSEVLKSDDIRRALVDTVKECGQGIVFTSLILGFGFGIMAIASTPGLASLGRFGFLAIFSGLVCELFLMPALILAFKLRFNRQERHPEIAALPKDARA